MRFLYRILRVFVPTYGTEYIFYYIAAAAAATGAIVNARNQQRNEAIRQQLLEQERTNAELAALDEENQRLALLAYANSDVIANAGNIDPFASESLLALRAEQHREANVDIGNIRTNLATSRANVSAMINISRHNSKVAGQIGILDAVSHIASGIAQGSRLKPGPKKPPPTKPIPGGVSKGGAGVPLPKAKKSTTIIGTSKGGG